MIYSQIHRQSLYQNDDNFPFSYSYIYIYTESMACNSHAPYLQIQIRSRHPLYLEVIHMSRAT